MTPLRALQKEDLVTVERATLNTFTETEALIEQYYVAFEVIQRDSPDALRGYIAGPESAVWIARLRDTAIGCILFRRLPELESAGEMKRLFVLPELRGRGVAGMLLEKLESFATSQNVATIYLDTSEQFVDALPFYRKRGYQECARYNDNPQATLFLRKSLVETVFVRLFKTGDAAAFRELNVAWISKYFALEKKDSECFADPQRYFIDPGGQIFMAIRNGKPVGCCALWVNDRGAMEISKMTVSETERGRGIGRKLLEFAIAYSKGHAIDRLYLETNDSLKDAVHLYETIGFTHIPPDRVDPSPYARANVFMEKIVR
jgi:putative acetyltransferase